MLRVKQGGSSAPCSTKQHTSTCIKHRHVRVRACCRWSSIVFKVVSRHTACTPSMLGTEIIVSLQGKGQGPNAAGRDADGLLHC